MRIETAELLPYRLSLDPPMPLGAGTVETRHGFLVCLRAESGEMGWGECAPLPGFSRETIADAADSVRSLAESLNELSLDPRLFVDPSGPIHRALDAATPPPSVRYALDLALWDLGAQSLALSLAQAMHPDPAVALPLCALLPTDPDAALARARELAGAGWRAVKVKVGRGDPEADARLIADLRRALGPGVEIRADANRAWGMDEAKAFAKGVAGADLGFVEEPLRDPASLPLLWMDTGLPIALDETVQIPQGEAFIRGWVSAVVLKPTLVGGIVQTLRLAGLARSVGARPVVSSAYESGVGMRGLVALAAATGAEPAGLDTARAFTSDTLATPLVIEGPFLDVPGLLPSELTLADPIPA